MDPTQHTRSIQRLLGVFSRAQGRHAKCSSHPVRLFDLRVKSARVRSRDESGRGGARRKQCSSPQARRERSALAEEKRDRRMLNPTNVLGEGRALTETLSSPIFLPPPPPLRSWWLPDVGGAAALCSFFDFFFEPPFIIRSQRSSAVSFFRLLPPLASPPLTSPLPSPLLSACCHDCLGRS